MNEELTLIQYGHEHCSGCKVMHNVLKNNNFKANIIIKNIEEDDEAFIEAQSLKVNNLPTTILFAGSKEIYRWVKPTTAENINKIIKQYYDRTLSL